MAILVDSAIFCIGSLLRVGTSRTLLCMSQAAPCYDFAVSARQDWFRVAPAKDNNAFVALYNLLSDLGGTHWPTFLIGISSFALILGAYEKFGQRQHVVVYFCYLLLVVCCLFLVPCYLLLAACCTRLSSERHLMFAFPEFPRWSVTAGLKLYPRTSKVPGQLVAVVLYIIVMVVWTEAISKHGVWQRGWGGVLPTCGPAS